MTAFSKKYYRSLEPLVKAVDHQRPLPWEQLFGRSASLELEIGFGNGEYLNRLSLECPEHDFVGVEIAWASIKRALRRLSAPSRSNVKVMQIKAETALERCFAPGSLSAFRSLFPVPWPDERSEKKRLFQRDFLNLAASRLKPEGRFIMVTDSQELAEWTMLQAETSALKLELEERPAGLDTKYERKWQGGGQRIFFHISGGKAADFTAAVPQEMEMQAYYRERFDPGSFSPQGCVGDIVVKFKEFIFDRERGQGLLRTFVVEGSLTQDFFIRICRESGRWKLSPAIASQLFPTQGVARALELASSQS